MDDSRSLRPVEDDQLQEVAGPVGTQHQVPGRVLADLLDEQRVPQAVLNVLVLNAVASCRGEHVDKTNRTTKSVVGHKRCCVGTARVGRAIAATVLRLLGTD